MLIAPLQININLNLNNPFSSVSSWGVYQKKGRVANPTGAVSRIQSTTQNNVGTRNFYEDLQKELMAAELRRVDMEVRAHEAAHLAAGGPYAGTAHFSYVKGPDGKYYAVAGEVPIDVSPEDTPQKTVANNPFSSVSAWGVYQKKGRVANPTMQRVIAAAHTSTLPPKGQRLALPAVPIKAISLYFDPEKKAVILENPDLEVVIPAKPSPQDYAVAALASQIMNQAYAEMKQEQFKQGGTSFSNPQGIYDLTAYKNWEEKSYIEKLFGV